MFDYQVSKHPHFDEACRAFALRHNLVQLAERAGMNVQILRNKLNPAQPHLLTAPEIWLLTDLTEDSTLVDGFLAQIHCLPCVPINEVAKEKLPHYVMSATAEIGRVAAGAVEELKRENEDLRRWADTPLPADIIRLRERPTLTGGAAYRQWLSASDAVSAGSGSAAH